ncbi:unnamed protein product [Peniophora sp. CBMAI 1063]|nr:unnamed protein product [Peniophora sp. CBMAI 1063]
MSAYPDLTPEERAGPLLPGQSFSLKSVHGHMAHLPSYAHCSSDRHAPTKDVSSETVVEPAGLHQKPEGTPWTDLVLRSPSSATDFVSEQVHSVCFDTDAVQTQYLQITSLTDIDNAGKTRTLPVTSPGLLTPPPTPPASRIISPPQGSYRPVEDGLEEPIAYFGKRKALCIGINYYDEDGHESDLESCIRDAKRMRRLLLDHFQYRKEDVVLLSDHPDHGGPGTKPTKDNILRAMKDLVHDARSGDSFFFHYSGHGFQTKDMDGDEEDGLDEFIYPMDYDTSGIILDDDLHDIMVKPLPQGCRFTAVYDSCHSGSVLDLPYLYTHDPDSGFLESQNELAILSKSSQADVICWSACKDREEAQCTKKTGAMSSAFRSALEKGFTLDYGSIFAAIDEDIRSNPHLTQRPQLSSSHPLDITRVFTI